MASRPLSLILNQSFAEGIFPDILTIDRFSPIHEKEDTLNVSNYCPISLYQFQAKYLKNLYAYSRI